MTLGPQTLSIFSELDFASLSWPLLNCHHLAAITELQSPTHDQERTHC